PHRGSAGRGGWLWPSFAGADRRPLESPSRKGSRGLSSAHVMRPVEEPSLAAAPVRVVTAAAPFDGHDAAINVIRRMLQARGAEVIHLGHDRSVEDVVTAAIQEDADAVAVSSYQGGHVEYFSYLVEELGRRAARHVRVYGGGGGVISTE